MPETEWRKLRADQLRDLSKQDAIVILPVASMEQHGPHLPVEVDSMLGETVAARTAAKNAAELLISVHYTAPKKSSPVVGTARLLRTSKDGAAGPSSGLLEDYACVAAGLLKLSGVTGEDRWTTIAG